MQSKIVDVDYLAAQTGGDEDLQAELLGLFARQLDDACHSLDGVTTVEAACHLLHRLNGSARAIGAGALGDRMDRIERDVRDAGDLQPFHKAQADLRALMHETSVCAASLIAARAPPGLAKRHENG